MNEQSKENTQPGLVDQQKFLYRAKEANTLIDTFLILGPNQHQLDQTLPILLAQPSQQSRLDILSQQVDVAIVSSFPDFSRKQIEIDDKNKQELIHQAFPHGYNYQLSQTQPQSRKMSAYQFGSDKRIYLQYYIFFERLEMHLLGYLQSQLASLQRQSVTTQNLQRSQSAPLITAHGKPFSDLFFVEDGSEEECDSEDSLDISKEIDYQQINLQTQKHQSDLEKNLLEQMQTLKQLQTVQQVWIPKAIGVASMYCYYDFFDAILLDLYERSQKESHTLIEQHIFNIVLKIPTPTRNKQKVKYPLYTPIYSNLKPQYLELYLPGIEELPFVNHSHFETLLDCMKVEDIIQAFTHMLFESKTLLIAPTIEQLVPISFALHSLIYPFKMCLFVPCLLNDGEQTDVNSINLVSSPLNYFIGIAQEDRDLAMFALQNDEFSPPLIIDVQPQNKRESSIITKLAKCAIREIQLQIKKSKGGPLLPLKLERTLIQKIEEALILNTEIESRSQECIRLIRQAFFDLIIDLFLNYKKRVSIVDGEPYFDYKTFLEESDPDYKQFFHQYLQIDSKGGQNNNQMFYNFLNITMSKNNLSVEDVVMTEHINSSIKRVQNLQAFPQDSFTFNRHQSLKQKNKSVNKSFKSSQHGSFILQTKVDLRQDELNSFVVSAVENCPISEKKLLQIYQTEKILPMKFLLGQPLRLRYITFPTINSKIMNSDLIVKVDEIVQDHESSTIRSQSIDRKVRIPPQSHDGVFVLIAWIFIWCFTLSYQDKCEAKFRMNQLRHVLAKLYAEFDYTPGTDLFYLIIESCYKNCTYDIAHTIYETLCDLNSIPDNKVKLIHFDHQREDIKYKTRKIQTKLQIKEIQKNNISRAQSFRRSLMVPQMQKQEKPNILAVKEEQEILNQSSSIYKMIVYNNNFRKRQFSFNDQETPEEVKLKLGNKCKSCLGQLLAFQIKIAVKRAQKMTNYDCCCPFCGSQISIPQLQIKTKASELLVNFMSAEALYCNIQYICLYEESNQTKRQGESLTPSYLKQNHEQELWNLLYYFNEYTLPQDLIMEYEKVNELGLLQEYKKCQKKQVIREL